MGVGPVGRLEETTEPTLPKESSSAGKTRGQRGRFALGDLAGLRNNSALIRGAGGKPNKSPADESKVRKSGYSNPAQMKTGLLASMKRHHPPIPRLNKHQRPLRLQTDGYGLRRPERVMRMMPCKKNPQASARGNRRMRVLLGRVPG